MAQQWDTYLVEKLREILQRLHSTSKLSGFGGGEKQTRSSSSNLLEVEENEEQVAFKRSPSHFPNALSSSPPPPSSDEIFSNSNLEDGGVLSKVQSIVPTFFPENETKKFPTTFFDLHTIGSDLVQNFSLNEALQNNITAAATSSSSSSESFDTITYGVEINSTSAGVDETPSSNQTYFGVNKVNSGEEDDSSALLTRNLHEFIHILKMSLKSGSSIFGSHENSDDIFFQKDNIPSSSGDNSFGSTYVRDASPTVHTGSTDPFSGIETASSTNVEFNFTLDDILDINNLLLDGSDSAAGVPLKHIFIIIFYSIIACVSILGNLLVVQLVIRSRRFHTLTHALLANLAISDLFLATFNIPFSAARVILSEWPFGSFLCRTVPFVQVTSVYATSFTMAVIAVDRYQVIMNPLGKRLKCSQGILLVIAIWTVSGVLSIPYALNHKVVTVLTVRVVKRCQAEFGSARSRQVLTIATFLAQYLLPLLFTTVSYISIMKRLWYRSSGLGSTTPRQVAAQSRAKRKTIKMLVLTVICFALSWAPINCYHLLTHFSHVRHNSTAILICHMIAMSSSMYNPFIFCGLNEHFRREAVKWLHCFRTRRSPTVHPGTEVNGMLARSDQVCHRNFSTTVVHTTLSSRRSPQQLSVSPRSCQRRRLAPGTSNSPTTVAAVYMTPRHHHHQHLHHSGNIPRSSPLVGRVLRDSSSCQSGSATSAGNYQPELLFLVKETPTSSTSNKCLTSQQIENGTFDDGEEEVVDRRAQEFPDSFYDEFNSLSDSKSKGKTIDSSSRHASGILSLDDSFANESDEGLKEETEFMG